MPHTKLIKFGDVVLPEGTSVASIERGRSIGTAKLARTQGARQTAGYRNGIRVVLRVPLFQGPMHTTELRARVDTFRASLAVGPDKLWLYNDRYYRCCEAVSEPSSFGETHFDRIEQVEVTFVGPDPLMFDSTTNTDTWSAPSTGNTRSIVAGGNAPAAPKFTITVGGSGAETIAFDVTNNTTGESFTLAGDVTAGDVIVVDCLLKTVTIFGANYLSLFDGLFPRFDVGANQMQLDWTSSSISSVVTTWQNRYE